MCFLDTAKLVRCYQQPRLGQIGWPGGVLRSRHLVNAGPLLSLRAGDALSDRRRSFFAWRGCRLRIRSRTKSFSPSAVARLFAISMFFLVQQFFPRLGDKIPLILAFLILVVVFLHCGTRSTSSIGTTSSTIGTTRSTSSIGTTSSGVAF